MNTQRLNLDMSSIRVLSQQMQLNKEKKLSQLAVWPFDIESN